MISLIPGQLTVKPPKALFDRLRAAYMCSRLIQREGKIIAAVLSG
jgi:hypothetical protein